MPNQRRSYLDVPDTDNFGEDWGIGAGTPTGSSEDNNPDDYTGFNVDAMRTALVNEMARDDEEAMRSAQNIGEECSKFCQDYSYYQMLKLSFAEHAQDKTFLPQIERTELDPDFENDESMVFGSPLVFYDFRVSIRDARAIAKAWQHTGYSDQRLESSLATTLSLCFNKMSIACRQFADYYQSLSAREKNILALNVQMHINLMLQLGGVEPVHSELSIDYLPEPIQFTNEYELQLQQAGINIDEIPDEFLCPISKQIMNNPTRVGYDTHWYTYDTATLQRLWADSGQSARCPFTNRPLSELTIEADTELEAKIKTWVEEKLESTKVKNVPK